LAEQMTRITLRDLSKTYQFPAFSQVDM